MSVFGRIVTTALVVALEELMREAGDVLPPQIRKHVEEMRDEMESLPEDGDTTRLSDLIDITKMEIAEWERETKGGS